MPTNRLLAAALLLLYSAPALAVGIQAGPPCADMGIVINGLGLNASRAFEHEGTNRIDGWASMTLFVDLTDADDSITRLDLTCTGSHDNNTTDYEIQDCTIAAGVNTCVDGGVVQKAVADNQRAPVYRVDVSGFADFECTFSVGAGAGAAADVLTVRGRLCAD